MSGLNRRCLFFSLTFIAILGTGSACQGETLSNLFEEAHILFFERPKQTHDVALPDINGRPFRLRDLHGKIVFLNIWATWCAPCREEMPSIEKLHQHFKGQDLVVIAVSVDMADIRIVKNFIERHNYTFTVLHDPRGDTMEWFHVRLIPVTYLINRSGKIIGKAVGLRDWGQDSMVRLFDQLLKSLDDEP
ncbi:MAG: redoxin domain-containing protein [Proteobacteria bacterium]|nr:redoxin domain-containing protein [Pseudomonadota bacterium]